MYARRGGPNDIKNIKVFLTECVVFTAEKVAVCPIFLRHVFVINTKV